MKFRVTFKYDLLFKWAVCLLVAVDLPLSLSTKKKIQYVSHKTQGSTSLQRLRSLESCCWQVVLASGCWWRRSISPSALLKILLWSWWAEGQANHSSLSISSFSSWQSMPPSHPNLHSTHAHPVRVSAWHSGCLQAKARPVKQKQQCGEWSQRAWDEQHECTVPSVNRAQSDRETAHTCCNGWSVMTTYCYILSNRAK